jgi:hypothetical protein
MFIRQVPPEIVPNPKYATALVLGQSLILGDGLMDQAVG